MPWQQVRVYGISPEVQQHSAAASAGSMEVGVVLVDMDGNADYSLFCSYSATLLLSSAAQRQQTTAYETLL